MPAPLSHYSALVVRKQSDGRTSAQVESLPAEQLPPGAVTIRVDYSSLNYKDALSIQGHPGVTTDFPHVPGVDAAGTVVANDAAGTVVANDAAGTVVANDAAGMVAENAAAGQFAAGSRVLITGFDFGSRRWGGCAELTRVPAEWLVPLPDGLSLRDAMALGTAGFTAALSVAALEHEGVRPESGKIVVTGSTGGVGSIAVALLAKLGYHVAAVTGKSAEHPLLARLGAKEILLREAVLDASDKPLLKAQWAGGIDTVGGATLATLLRSTSAGGCVTACGLVGGVQLPLTVYPFILRGVRLVGIDSVGPPMAVRLDIWRRLADAWKLDLSSITREISLAQTPGAANELLAGRGMGRTVVRVTG